MGHLFPKCSPNKATWGFLGWVPCCACQTSLWGGLYQRIQNKINPWLPTSGICSNFTCSNSTTWWNFDWNFLVALFNIVKTLSYSRNSSPLFAHRKSSGKLRKLTDLRRLNRLLRQDFLNSNFPISKQTYSTNGFAGKVFVCKLDYF